MGFTIKTDHDGDFAFGDDHSFDILEGGELAVILGRPVLIVAAGEWRTIEIAEPGRPREPSSEQLKVLDDVLARLMTDDGVGNAWTPTIVQLAEIWKAAVDG